MLAVMFPIHNICFSSGMDVDREQRRKYLLSRLVKLAMCFSSTFVQGQRTAGVIPILSPPRRMISKTFSIAVVRTRLQVFGGQLVDAKVASDVDLEILGGVHKKNIDEKLRIVE